MLLFLFFPFDIYPAKFSAAVRLPTFLSLPALESDKDFQCSFLWCVNKNKKTAAKIPFLFYIAKKK